MDLERTSSSETLEHDGQGRSERNGFLFQPDILVGEEYFEQRSEKFADQPEKRLVLAILQDAVNCFQQNHSARHGERRAMFAEAEAWIFAASDWVFGFENVCSVLGYDPDYVRSGLRRWRERELSKSSKLLWKKPSGLQRAR